MCEVIKTKSDSIKTVVAIMMEINNEYYKLSDEDFVDGVIEVLKKFNLTDDSCEAITRMFVANIVYRSRKDSKINRAKWMILGHPSGLQVIPKAEGAF